MEQRGSSASFYIPAVSFRDIVWQMSSVHQWRQIGFQVWEEDVPIMKEEWSNAGWSVASIHTWKSGDGYKADIKYKRTAGDDTIHTVGFRSMWRQPTGHFRPTGITYELDSPEKLILKGMGQTARESISRLILGIKRVWQTSFFQ